ncbi:signal peptide peptidase SppA [Rhodothermaceae bacterium RA]|nr:signal peptide peptidase SppA [Rhodothermaceae bacterium RA]
MRFLSTLIASTLGTLIAVGVLFLLSMMFIVALVASTETAPRVRSGSVLVMELGSSIPELTSDDPLTMALMGQARYDLRDLTRTLARAAADERIEAVWLQLRGLQASWATLEELRAALLAFKDSGKPLIASTGAFPIAEADYFLASTADDVYADPEGFVEFNGFFITAEFYKDLLDRLDVRVEAVRAGEFKSAVEPFTRTDLSEANREQLRALLEAQNRVFMQAVAESRSMAVEDLMRLAETAAPLTAQDAHDAGLIDGLLYHDEVENVLKSRLGLEKEDTLPTTSLGAYVRVSDADAGLPTGSDGDIAVVYAVGNIVPGKSGYDTSPLFGGMTLGTETFRQAMQEARTSERVRAVVVRINSPGGFAPAADAMLREVELTAREKPVIVSMGDVAASGGYWMAMAADTIVANPLTLTGSIGVFSLFVDAGDFFANKLGITHEVLTTSPYADMFSAIEPLSEAERALMQRSTYQTYRRFLEEVAENRGMTVDAVDAVAQGRVWRGVQAQEAGLVDVLGTLETAIRLAAERAGLEEGTYRIRILPRPKTVLEQFNEALQARIASAWFQFRTTPAERAVLEHARVLHSLTERQASVQAWLPTSFTIR